ncbi:MAG: hypothetical protein QF921_01025 [Pseudomonadales bacterium]|nr:hypothetical protein [Pseudomonadales bacterium]MDP6471355.1 hypothetical protein [Pseudomonadales bacterium]MDP6826453.1 hypothetical protein [Pseudomonadales bacterium]MDP6970092.1 hypothetical protein [Pseudomonadales bacterium]
MLDALEEAAPMHAPAVGRVLARYLDIVVDDVRAVMLLARVCETRHQRRRALAVLIDAAEFTGGADGDVIEEHIARLAGRYAEELRETGARDRLVSFYEYMVTVRAHQDAYRVGWIRALGAGGGTPGCDDAHRSAGQRAVRATNDGYGCES